MRQALQTPSALLHGHHIQGAPVVAGFWILSCLRKSGSTIDTPGFQFKCLDFRLISNTPFRPQSEGISRRPLRNDAYRAGFLGPRILLLFKWLMRQDVVHVVTRS